MKKRIDDSRKYRSEAMAALHEAASDLHAAGGLDKLTMRQFDLLCLTLVEDLSARDIQALRERAGVSQGVFARVLNVKPGLVSQWERGERRPSGPSLKLLSLIKAKGFEAVV
ncbi:MAG TPA: DNA-binding transcriptional regulator [Hyphomicrobiaceae bacterium]|jgi:putative transcriptional regulator